ncbi:SRPBCC family protein [Actinocrinis puniceicyclus]|uniref:SRPBCC family protein n=1 Tax=Actinocrinis puniceicyclus TaxID=977794 RepID=A0A8J8BCQ8_9ACTN|nr:SRPBCC family protein [Actinocrinis puniceicyclus]MBS2963760.1 SRPBCC family protein [Actinocrinis puniceicyclus]
MPRFELVTSIAAAPAEVFGASLDVEVHTGSMAKSAERAVGGVTAGRLKLGDCVTWRARHFAIWWRMTSKISACAPPEHFTDEQVVGPFKYWRHEHRFEADSRGGTVMRDEVDFEAPFGLLGAFAQVVVLRRYLIRLIRIRNQHIKTVTESAAPGSAG